MTRSVGRFLLAVATGLATFVAPPSRATSPAPPSLAGTTTVVGSAPAVMRVRATSEIRLTPELVTIAGNGRFAGVVLRRVGSPLDEPDLLYLIRYNMCFDGPACAPYNPQDYFYFAGRFADHETSFTDAILPAGDYQIYLFADGTPVSVRLIIPGLAGSVTLAPSKPLPVQVAVPQPAVPREDPATPYYSAAATHAFGGAAAGALHALRFDVPRGHVETIYGTCAFTEPALPRRPMGPGCPRQRSVFPTGNVIDDGEITAGSYKGYIYGGFFDRPAVWTLGDYYLNAGPTTNGVALFVLFNFDDSYTP